MALLKTVPVSRISCGEGLVPVYDRKEIQTLDVFPFGEKGGWNTIRDLAIRA